MSPMRSAPVSAAIAAPRPKSASGTVATTAVEVGASVLAAAYCSPGIASASILGVLPKWLIKKAVDKLLSALEEGAWNKIETIAQKLMERVSDVIKERKWQAAQGNLSEDAREEVQAALYRAQTLVAADLQDRIPAALKALVRGLSSPLRAVHPPGRASSVTGGTKSRLPDPGSRPSLVGGCSLATHHCLFCSL